MNPPRQTALKVINRVTQKESYTNLLLASVLEKSNLGKKDRALTTELVSGTLRRLGTLDWIVSQHSNRPLEKIPLRALNILRLGCYQLFYSDRIPDRAAINESVNLAKEHFHIGLASFVNGVLRNISRNKNQVSWGDPKEDPIAFISLKYAHPRWLVERWLKEYGLEETEALCKANNRPPKLVLRTNTLRISPSDLAQLLKKKGILTSKSPLVSEALVLESNGYVAGLPSFEKGLFSIQGEASVLASHVVSPKPGETIVDTCAAPGGKSTHLAELMQNRGKVLAIDINPARVNLIKENSERLGTSIVKSKVTDATTIEETIKFFVDKVLVDAPCSGLGTLARRPDARWRKNPQQIKTLSKIQKKILSSASKIVRKGGTLTYAVCTTTKEESEEVCENFLKGHPQYKIDDISDLLPKNLKVNTKYGLRLLPHKNNTDGMFMARFLKK